MAPGNGSSTGSNTTYFIAVHALGDRFVCDFGSILSEIVVAFRFVAILVAPQGNSSPLHRSDFVKVAALCSVVCYECVQIYSVAGIFTGQTICSAVIVAGLILSNIETVDLHAVDTKRRMNAGISSGQHIAQTELRNIHHDAGHFLIVVLHAICGADTF